MIEEVTEKRILVKTNIITMEVKRKEYPNTNENYCSIVHRNQCPHLISVRPTGEIYEHNIIPEEKNEGYHYMCTLFGVKVKPDYMTVSVNGAMTCCPIRSDTCIAITEVME